MKFIGNVNQIAFPMNDGIHSNNAQINNKEVIQFEPSYLYFLYDFIFKNVISKR